MRSYLYQIDWKASRLTRLKGIWRQIMYVVYQYQHSGWSASSNPCTWKGESNVLIVAMRCEALEPGLSLEPECVPEVGFWHWLFVKAGWCWCSRVQSRHVFGSGWFCEGASSRSASSSPYGSRSHSCSIFLECVLHHFMGLDCVLDYLLVLDQALGQHIVLECSLVLSWVSWNLLQGLLLSSHKDLGYFLMMAVFLVLFPFFFLFHACFYFYLWLSWVQDP